MGGAKELSPRDLVKRALRYEETDYVPYQAQLGPKREEELTEYYGDEIWRGRFVSHIGLLAGVDHTLVFNSLMTREDSSQRDSLGCSWELGSILRLVDWPLHEPELGDYRLPDLDPYFDRHLR